jgi:hypothetical protein
MANGRAALEVFVGEWVEQMLVPDAPAGRATFEWTLDGKYLLQRSDSPQPDFPDGLVIISYDEDSGGYTQHYFDSRGVTRLYRMSLSDGVWTLLRDRPDFSPLDFAQRFQGTFSPDGNTIDGRWETSPDGGATWDLDFGLRYTRVT